MPNDLVFTDTKKVANTSDEFMSIWANFVSAKEQKARQFARSEENWRFYVALDSHLGMGPWPSDAVQHMNQQGRQIHCYNFVAPIVDTIAGGIMQSPYDPEVYPVNGKMNKVVMAVKKAMYSDKEITDWPGTYLQLVKAGLIHEGVISIDVVDDYDDLGNIALNYRLPGSVIPDPMWKSWKSKDCEICWVESWLMPEKILAKYKELELYVANDLEKVARHGFTYGPDTGPTPFNIGSTMWGDARQVIEEYRVVTRKVPQSFAITKYGDVPIPTSVPDDKKVEWLNQNLLHLWQPDQIYEKETKEKVCIARAIVPSISTHGLFAKGPTEVQIGRLPFFWWSAQRSNGEPKGVVDSVKDIQTNLNYWESLLTNKIQNEGGGGSQLVDPAGFQSDEETKRFIENRNNPGESFLTKPGVLIKGGAAPVRPVINSPFPQEVYQHLQHMIQVLLPYVSYVTPAQRGMKDGANPQSGYLYRLMQIQSEQQLYTIHYSLRQFWNEVYEAYFIQASQTYANELLPRTFTFNKGKESITINERVDMGNGQVGLRNDIRQLQSLRLKVIISENQQSPTQKMEQLGVVSEFVKAIPADMIGTRQYLVNKASSLIDTLDDDDKDALRVIGDIELELTVTDMTAKIAQAKVATYKANEELKQLELRASAPPTPPPGEGIDAQGPGGMPPNPQQLSIPPAPPMGQVDPTQLGMPNGMPPTGVTV